MLRQIFDPDQKFSIPKEEESEKYELVNDKSEPIEFEYE
jgi:hypothetical protein